MSETQNNIIRFNYSVDPTTLMSNSWITTNTDTTQNTVTGVDPTTVTVTYRDVTYSIEDLSHNPLASGVLRVFYTIEKGTLFVTDVTVLSGSSIDHYGTDKDDLLIGIDKNEYVFSDFASAPENTTQTTSESSYTNTWSYVNGSSTETIYDHYEVELYVNSDVTTFPNNLFYDDNNITSIEFDTYSITSFEDGSKGSSGAFLHCVNLVSIILPNNIEYIGDFAVFNNSVTSIILPSTVEEIGGTAFGSVSVECYAINPPILHSNAFEAINSLTIHETALQSYINSDWADYVTSIDTIETQTYDNVLKFNYSEDPTTFLNNLWVNSCTDTSANTIVPVGEHTETITTTHYWRTITFDFTGKGTFAGVFRIEVDNTGVPVEPFNFESISGDTVDSISYQGGDRLTISGPFGGCELSNFSTAVENQTYTEIGDIPGTWSYVASTTTTTETVTTYDHYEVTLYINSALNTFETTMFADDENITSVEFDYDVTSIIDDAFNGCENLSSVTLTSTVPPTIGEDTFSLISPDAVLYVPNTSIPAYQTAGFGDYFGEIRGTSPEPPTPFRGYGFNRTNMIDIDYLNEIGIRFNR